MRFVLSIDTRPVSLEVGFTDPGGHVPEALRAMPSVQAAQSKISTLAPRIKSAFDPGNIFAPGRLA